MGIKIVVDDRLTEMVIIVECLYDFVSDCKSDMPISNELLHNVELCRTEIKSLYKADFHIEEE